MGDKGYVPQWGAGVTPEEWRRRLLQLPSPAREAAARIIWWEFLSLRLVADRCAVLDDLLLYAPPVPDEVLMQALVAVGMPPLAAERRVKPPKPRASRRKEVAR